MYSLNLREGYSILRTDSNEIYDSESLSENPEEIAEDIAEELDGRFYSWNNIGVVLSGTTRFDLCPKRHLMWHGDQLIVETSEAKKYIEDLT